MTHIYKEGDRVRLVTDGGYCGPEFFPGALGTVVYTGYQRGGFDVSVDGCTYENLYFRACEIEPYTEEPTETDISELAYRMASIGAALALRLTDVVGKEDIVERWERVLDEYRRATAQTQDTIPWDAISPKYNWSARDEDGGIWVYRGKPIMQDDMREWHQEVSDDWGRIDHMLNITPGNAPWQESLQCRPGYEGE